ncbi:MAG: RecB family exonuclease [Acidimicrobiia bacterium]
MFTFPEVAAGDPIRVSATAYRIWLQCPEQARNYLDVTVAHERRYQPETIDTFRGSLAHRIFARHLVDGPIADDAFERVCRQESGTGPMPMKMGSLGLKPSQFKALTFELADEYQRFQRLAVEGFQAAEVGLVVEAVEGVTLVGRVDAVFDLAEGGVALVDWKTGELGDAQPQLDFYAALWALRHGEVPARVEAASVRTGERFEDHPSVAGVEATLDMVADLVTSVRRALASGTELERQGGPNCRFCPILTGCPEGATAVNLAFPVRGRAR